MADTLESLEIEVKHNASGADAEINKLADSIRGLSASLNGVPSKLRKLVEVMNAVKGNMNVTINDNSTSQTAGTINNIKQYASKASQAQKEVAKGVKELSSAAKKSQSPLANFVSSLKRIAFYRMIRSIIKSITAAFQEGLKNAYAFSQGIITEGHRFSTALDAMSTSSLMMKNQLGSAFISLLAAIAPIVNQIIGLVVRLADALSQFFAAFTGGTYLKAVNFPQKWADGAGGAAKAAKEWKNQLLGFDEINRLEEPSDTGRSGGGGSGVDTSQMFVDTPINDNLKKFSELIKQHLTEIELFAEGALIGMGLILLLTGANVPLGLGLIALGGIKMAQPLTENWDYITSNISNKMAAIEMIAAGAFLAMGLMLLMSGANIPLGLGLLGIGALSMASAIAENWDIIPEKIKKVIAMIDLAVGGALLAVGALLTFTGANPVLGIGMMVAGIGLSLAGGHLAWDSIPNKLTNILTTIGMILGGAMLALGAVLLFATPAFSPIGLALVVAGVASLAAAVGLNWDWAKNAVKAVVGSILAIVGGALVVLGVMLCLSGAGIPLGLGLIYAGMKTSYAAFNISDNAITRAVKQIADNIWNTATSLINGIIGGIKAVIDWVRGAFDWLNGLGSRISAINERATGMGYGVFATGGFPESGQLFMAREAGPELVGTMGGRTAVANNDQIVAAIEGGVFRAMSAAMSSNGGSGNHTTIIDINGREFFRATYNDQKAVAKERGISLIANG